MNEKKTNAGHANIQGRPDIHLLSQQANRVRAALIEDYKEGRIDFDDVLSFAATQKPIGRMRMSRILKIHGWKKRQFTVAINVLKLPINNRLEWWVKEQNKSALEKLYHYVKSGELRASVSERFPWSDEPIEQKTF